MTVNRVHISNQTIGLFFKVMVLGVMEFICVKTAWAVPMDLKSYDPACEVILKEVGESLVIGWDTPEGSDGADPRRFGAGSFGAIGCRGTRQGGTRRGFARC
jgi:hypothetical protein